MKLSKKSPNVMEQYDKKQINLLPDLYFKKKRRVRLTILVSMLVAVAAVGFALQVQEVYSQLRETRELNKKTIAAIQEKEEERRRQNLLVALKGRIEFKVDLLKEIESKNASVLNVAETIESALPEGVLYVSVDFESEESMKIYGRTEKKEEIPDLMRKLREKNIFKKIEAETISKIDEINYKGEETYYNFILICSFGGDDDETDE